MVRYNKKIISTVVKSVVIIYGIVFIFFAGAPLQAEVKIASHTIVNVEELDNLANETGLSKEEAEVIKSKVEDQKKVSIKPEVTFPTVGSVVSCHNILFKGVSTPNVNITLYIKDIEHAENSTMTAKTTSDAFGVWSYSLGKTLKTSTYTIMATADDPDLGTVNSEIIKFSAMSEDDEAAINKTEAAKNAVGGLLAGGAGDDWTSEKMFFAIVIAGILCFTLLLALIILSAASYLKFRQKKSEIGMEISLDKKEILQTAGISESEWKRFLIKMGVFLKMMKSAKSKKQEEPIMQINELSEVLIDEKKIKKRKRNNIINNLRKL